MSDPKQVTLVTAVLISPVALLGHLTPGSRTEYTDNYRDISYHDNLALSFCIDLRYYGFMIIVSYRILIT